MNAIILILASAAFNWSSVPEPYQGRGWNGLFPLHSTRADVTRKLGTGEGSCKCMFTTEQETIVFGYAESPCKGPLYGWNVPGGTVLTILVTPKKPKPFRPGDLGKEYVESREEVVTTHYTNIEKGIQYTVQNGAIVSIRFIPTAQDAVLRCEGFPRYDGGLTEYNPFDVFGRIAESDMFARLDNFAIELVNNPELKGYIISYAGRASRAHDATAIATKARDYLIARREIAPERIVATSGGFREQPELELYLVKTSLPPPSPKPTLSSTEVTIVKDQ